MSIVFSLNLKSSGAAGLSAGGGAGESLSWRGKNGTACVLIHGLTGTPYEMKFLGAALNRKGYSVLCPRLANHGAPLDVLKSTKWQTFYQSAREALLSARREYDRIFVGGLSMGALFALLLAEEFPEYVSGVSCLSPTLFYDGWNTPNMKWLLPLAYATPLKHFFYFKEDPPYGIKNEAIRRYVDRYYSKATLDDLSGVEQYGYPFFPLTLLHQLKRLVKFLTPRLGRIRTPIQLIQASQDDMTSVKNSQYIYDRVRAEKKELVLLDDSYHVITADQERDKVAQKMVQFYSEVAGAGNAGPSVRTRGGEHEQPV